jgi:hypothetical protein
MVVVAPVLSEVLRTPHELALYKNVPSVVMSTTFFTPEVLPVAPSTHVAEPGTPAKIIVWPVVRSTAEIASAPPTYAVFPTTATPAGASKPAVEAEPPLVTPEPDPAKVDT